MLSQLQLNCNELLCYAVIYGFSQDGVSMYMGSLNYLKRLLNVSQPTIIKALKSLCERGLIKKYEVDKDKVRHCYYSIIPDAIGGTKETLVGGTKETLVGGTKETLVNKDIYKENKKENNNKELEQELFMEDTPECLFDKWFKENFPQLAKNDRPLKYKTYINLQSKYTKEQILLKLNAMEAKRNFNKEYCDVGRTLYNWLARDNKPIIKKA